MSTQLALRTQDLINNPSARVPICLCLDTSGTMGWIEGDYEYSTGRTYYQDGREWNEVVGGKSRLDKLVEGLEKMYEELMEDEIARYSAEICIVTFDSTAKCVLDFDTIDRQRTVPALNHQGDTHMGEGINLALDLLEQRKREYQSRGVDYFQPWLVLMTDGTPNGNASELERAIQRTTSMEAERKLSVFPIAIGEEVDMSILARLSRKRVPIRLKGMRFKEFFEWLSQSVSRTSQSTPGESIPLDIQGLKGWASLD